MISIIVPIYNSEKSLSKCIESISNQSYINLEIILINDGSSDRSLEICKSYAKKDERIIIIDQENSGVSSTRNVGIRKASGKYIQFVDSDDFIDNKMCEEMLKSMKSNNADMVVCGYKAILPWRTRKIIYNKVTYEPIKKLEEDFSYLLNNSFFHSLWNKLYKKEFIYNRLDEGISLGEDFMFNLGYFGKINKIAVISECYYNYVNSPDLTLSKIVYDNEIDLVLIRYNKLVKFCKNNNFSESVYVIILEKMMGELKAVFLKKKISYFINLNNYNQYKNEINKVNNNIDFQTENIKSLTSKLIYKKKYLSLWSVMITNKVKADFKKYIKILYIKMYRGG